LSVFVTVLPADTDPDVLARRDPERLRSLLGEAKPVLEFVLDRIAARSDLERADGRRRFLAEALPLVAGEPDPLTRELYLGTLSSLTGLDQEALRREAAAVPPPAQRTAAASGETNSPRRALPNGTIDSISRRGNAHRTRPRRPRRPRPPNPVRTAQSGEASDF
jgi:DNA primase